MFSHPQPHKKFEAGLELHESLYKLSLPTVPRRQICKRLGETITKSKTPSKAMKSSCEESGGKEK